MSTRATGSSLVDANDEQLAQFRDHVRTWAAQHVPTGWQDKYRDATIEEYATFQRSWIRELQSGGFAAPHWAKQWGGSELDLARQVVLFEEFSRAGAPGLRTFFVALNHTYATLSEWGTQEQRERHLPRILSGDEVWCQGFSEPGAGSDLAGLRTRAVRDGDNYIVNGQKVWSSGAMVADWCLLLTRTDPEAPKRKGITFLLLDLRTPGVDIRPIKQASGEAEFCELFFDDVVIPVGNRVGEENQGWAIAQSTLTAERGPTLLELSARLGQAMDWLAEDARTAEVEPGKPALADSAIREQLAALRSEVTILQLLCHKVIRDLLYRGGAGPEASIIKVYYSELLQRVAAFGVELTGLPTHEYVKRSVTMGWETGEWLLDYVVSWAWITGGGTNQIQRNVIGERVLGLPREPQV